MISHPGVHQGLRPGRKASQLEFVIALTLVAAFAAWLALRFQSAQADVRVVKVREVAAAMRMLSREVHLQAQVAHAGDITGVFPTAYGAVNLLRGQPSADAAGIGQLMAQYVPARQMACAAVQLAHPVHREQTVNAYECAPSELTSSERSRCAARYVAPLWEGGDPVVTFLLRGQSNDGVACESI
jgi:type II secretory pathway pseudopilin PulG